MIQDNIDFEMYPFVSKESFLTYKRLYEEQKAINDDLHNKLDLFDYAIKEGTIKDTKLKEVIRQNILLEFKIKSFEKKFDDIDKENEQLKKQIKRIQEEIQAEEDRVKLSVQRWINVEDNTKLKVAEFEKISYEVDKLQKLKLQIIKDIKGYIPIEEHTEIKLLPTLTHRENKKVNKLLRQIDRKLNAPFFKENNKQKAQHMLFEVKQAITFMDDKQKEFYNKRLEELQNAI